MGDCGGRGGRYLGVSSCQIGSCVNRPPTFSGGEPWALAGVSFCIVWKFRKCIQGLLSVPDSIVIDGLHSPHSLILSALFLIKGKEAYFSCLLLAAFSES